MRLQDLLAEQRNAGVCVICLEAGAPELLSLCCGCATHYRCLSAWLRRKLANGACPICRHVIDLSGCGAAGGSQGETATSAYLISEERAPQPSRIVPILITPMGSPPSRAELVHPSPVERTARTMAQTLQTAAAAAAASRNNSGGAGSRGGGTRAHRALDWLLRLALLAAATSLSLQIHAMAAARDSISGLTLSMACGLIVAIVLAQSP